MKAFLRFLFSLRTLLIVVLVLALIGGGAYWYFVQSANAGGPGFRTEAAVRKNLTATISATGTIEPTEVVDIGSQVTGQILHFGVDPSDSTKIIDYCTPVKEGTVLAVIDPKIYKAQLDEKDAALKGAQASPNQALTQKHITEDTLQRDLAAPAATTAQQQVQDRDATEVSSGVVKAAEANVALAQAVRDQAQTNLDYCTIKAPVDGVIVDRRVNVGQTVVANLSAASLFLLAKDLSHVQVWASVNEADIGNIQVGQEATFAVDARPGKTYTGTVSQIRLNASMTQNVVTYTVVVYVENKDGALRPGMTANATIEIAHVEGATIVPLAAFTYTPPAGSFTRSHRNRGAQTGGNRASGSVSASPWGSTNASSGGAVTAGAAGRIFVLRGGTLQPVPVKVGLVGATQASVTPLRGTLGDTDQVITGDNRSSSNSASRGGSSANPLAGTQRSAGGRGPGG